MIDLHAHVLAGLDDGPSDLDESIEMCRIAVQDGITTIVATPHTGNGVYVNVRDRIIAEVASLNGHLKSREIPIEVLPGADVHVSPDIGSMVQEGTAMTVNDNGRYIAVECPDRMIPPNFEEWIFAVRLKGITPILTHPERNLVIQHNTTILYRWVELGALVQITAMSLIGRFGHAAERSAREMLLCNLVHIIATDAHSVSGRPPLLSAARAAAASLVGGAYAEMLVDKIPGQIISGAPVNIPEPIRKKQGLFRRFLSLDKQNR